MEKKEGTTKIQITEHLGHFRKTTGLFAWMVTWWVIICLASYLALHRSQT